MGAALTGGRAYLTLDNVRPNVVRLSHLKIKQKPINYGRGNLKIYYYCHKSSVKWRKLPTNSEFIAMVADKLRIEDRVV